MKKLILGLCVVALASACTTAGPFVTNISSDGTNGLNIEKCSLYFNSFSGTVSNKNCTTQKIQLSRQ